MRMVQRWLTVAFTVAVLSTGTIDASPYGGEEPPILPEAPQTATIFQQALQNLANELAARTESLTPTDRGDLTGLTPGQQYAFQLVSAGEQAAAQGRSPIADFQKALNSFEDAIAKNPNDMAAHRGLLRAQSGIVGYNILKGNLDSVTRDLEHAEEGAIAALRKSPNDPGLLHLLGNLMATKATRPGISDEDREKAFQAAKSYYERAGAAGRLDSLRVYVPPPEPALQGTSSWINYFLERDARPR